MPLDLATLLVLAPACAPAVAPSTMLAVAHAESGFDPLAIGVNGPRPTRLRFDTRAAAADAARRLIAKGRNIDLGLAQINSVNLGALGLTVEAAFDPCANLTAAASILQAGYQRALRNEPDPQQALRTAFSLYNTGDRQRGFRNGYVARVERSARSVPIAPAASTPPAERSPAAPWDIFGDLRQAAFVTTPSLQNGDQP